MEIPEDTALRMSNSGGLETSFFRGSMPGELEKRAGQTAIRRVEQRGAARITCKDEDDPLRSCFHGRQKPFLILPFIETQWEVV